MFAIVKKSLAVFSFISVINFASMPSYADSTDDPGNGQKAYVYVTLFGSPDNEPPGTGNIAYPVLHKKAGGVGTYNDPVTFAVKRGYLPIAQRIYYPSLRKYFIMEDECASCSRNHVNLWAGYGSKRGGILRCEEALTVSSALIIISPDASYPVDTTPIWDEATKKCQKPYSS